jgi:hypothetical protein
MRRRAAHHRIRAYTSTLNVSLSWMSTLPARILPPSLAPGKQLFKHVDNLYRPRIVHSCFVSVQSRIANDVQCLGSTRDPARRSHTGSRFATPLPHGLPAGQGLLTASTAAVRHRTQRIPNGRPERTEHSVHLPLCGLLADASLTGTRQLADQLMKVSPQVCDPLRRSFNTAEQLLVGLDPFADHERRGA